jgi:excisionase family DNA binding protein
VSEQADKLLTIAEVAQTLRLHENTVRTFISRGEIPASRLGKQYRVRASALADYVDARNVRANAADLVERTTLSQGIPHRVDDPAVLMRVAALVGTQPAKAADDAA